VQILTRFRGPTGSGNGGYSCGLLGARLGNPAEVSLRLPPPLETELRVEGNRLVAGDAVIAEGRPTALDVAPPPAPSLAEAQEASARYRDDGSHPFPECFTCGPHREPGDGLRVFGMPVAGHPGLVAHWEAPDELPVEVLWAAMDCMTGWVHLDGGPSVLASLAVRIDGEIGPGPKVIHAWPTRVQGRKLFSDEALYDAGGRRLAVARALWIRLRDPAAFQARVAG
jgi:hypothetical protein